MAANKLGKNPTRNGLMVPDWQPKTPEIWVPYKPTEKDKYHLTLDEYYHLTGESCVYYKVRWHLVPKNKKGRGRSHGEFPVVVAREYFRGLGYTVLASEPRLFNPVTSAPEGYVLLSFSGYRERNHESYGRMTNIFGVETLTSLNRIADTEKRRFFGHRGGGDPDLFVYKGAGKTERFFVEVKEKEPLRDVQKLCFRLIEDKLGCDVKICRVYPEECLSVGELGAEP